MKHLRTVSRKGATPARAESLLVTQARVAILASIITSIFTAIIGLQELSDLFAKEDRFDNN